MSDRAILIDNKTGRRVTVYQTKEHPSCSYGKAIWVDSLQNPYVQVGMENMQSRFSFVYPDEITKERRRIIGTQVRRARETLGLSENALAERSGVKPATVVNIEKGRFSADLDTLELIANALGKEIVLK